MWYVIRRKRKHMDSTKRKGTKYIKTILNIPPLNLQLSSRFWWGSESKSHFSSTASPPSALHRNRSHTQKKIYIFTGKDLMLMEKTGVNQSIYNKLCKAFFFSLVYYYKLLYNDRLRNLDPVKLRCSLVKSKWDRNQNLHQNIIYIMSTIF